MAEPGRKILGSLIVLSMVFSLVAVLAPVVSAQEDPVYPGATEDTEAEALLQLQFENVGIVRVYTSLDSSSTIADWYRTEMTQLGWTKENESTSSYEGQTVYYFLYKQIDRGLILAMEPGEGGNSMIVTLAGSWESISLFLGLHHLRA